jgi:hypothetical protein
MPDCINQWVDTSILPLELGDASAAFQPRNVHQEEVVRLSARVATGHEDPVSVRGDLGMEMRFLATAVGRRIAGERNPLVFPGRIVDARPCGT